MSHFIGLVFVRPENDLDETLAPFSEQDEKYMEFVDKTDEVKAEYEKLPESCPTEGTYTETIDRTDDINQIWDEAPEALTEEEEQEFWKPYSKKDYPTPADIAKEKKFRIVEDESKRNGLRFEQDIERHWAYEASKEKYPTLDEYARRYHGYTKLRGKYGYMSNPEAKYDWYRVGGRWSGYLYNSEGATTDEELLTEVDWDKTFAESGVPFCFVNAEGEWCEKGEMGWFAMVANEKPTADWHSEFKEYVRTLIGDEEADEIVVYAVDFHI